VYVSGNGEVTKAVNSSVTVLCQAVISSCSHLIGEFSKFRTLSSLASCTVQERRNASISAKLPTEVTECVTQGLNEPFNDERLINTSRSEPFKN
jgi:hypothetical protein